MESFAKYTNKYAERERKRRQKKGPERPSKYKKWKPMNIGEIYIFLEILIHMSSKKMSKIKDYWRIPRGSLDRFSCIGRYMSLRRFESFYRMFTILPNLINELTEKVPVRQKPKT
jgi:hypothetical protein